MKIYFVNQNYPVSMVLYATRLWQYLRAVQPDWNCDSLAPLIDRVAGQPNKYFRNFSDFIASPFFLKWGIRQDEYSLFHIIDHSYAYLLDFLDRTKTVVTCHDLMMLKVAAGEIGPRGDQTKFKSTTIKRNIKRIRKIGQAARIVAVSNNTKFDLIKYLGINDKKIEVVYSGLNYDFHPIDDEKRRFARKKYGLTNERLILCVGNNQFYKNLEGIIEALAIKIDYLRSNNVVLMKAGSDFSESQKRLIERYALRSQVKYVGYVCSFELLNELYNLADVFLFPSLYEGFGWPPLEAMACGIPVIASDAGSLKEVLNGAAYTVNPTNYEQIAQALIDVLEDRSMRASLIAKGFTNAARFSWAKAANAYSTLYATILNAGRRSDKIGQR